MIGKKNSTAHHVTREPPNAVCSFVAELNLHNLLTLGRNQSSLDLRSLNRRFPLRPAPRTQGHPRPELSFGVFVTSRLVFRSCCQGTLMSTPLAGRKVYSPENRLKPIDLFLPRFLASFFRCKVKGSRLLQGPCRVALKILQPCG